MRILEQTDSKVHLEFDSLTEMVAVRDMPREQTKYMSSEERSKSTKRNRFLGTRSYDEAADLCLNGWHKGRKQLSNLTETGIQRLDMSPVRQVVYDVAGFSPNVPMYCAGMPDCMMTYDEVTKPSVLRLVVDGSRHGNVTATQMMNYGAALLAYIEMIEAEGIRCEIWLGFCTEYSGKEYSTRVRVKESDQPFDYAALAFALGHASMHRRIHWRVKEQFAELWYGCGQTKDGWDSGYGSADPYPLRMFEGHTIFRVPAINETYTDCRTLAGALGVFEATIENILRSYSEQESA